MSALSLDRTKVWFGISPRDGKVHAVHRTHVLCDSSAADTLTPIVTDRDRAACGPCLALLNNAVHDGRGARYGGH